MTDSAKDLVNDPVKVAQGLGEPNRLPAAIAVTQATTEVLVNQAIAIAGTADFQQVAQILVTLPNNAAIKVQTNATAGTWQAKIPSGLPSPAAIYLRVRALGRDQQILQELIINVLVRGQAIALTVKQNTIFKRSTADSATLPPTARVEVRAGQTFEVWRYGSVDGHIKVLLKQPIAPVGEFGYFYAPHVELLAPVTLVVKQDTVFKVSTASSVSLPFDQKVTVKAGTRLLLKGKLDENRPNNHIFVKLGQPISPVGAEGYFFLPHVDLIKLEESLDFAPPTPVDDIPMAGASLTVITDTFVKVSSLNASSLNDAQKLLVKAGTTYPIQGYASVNGHFRVKFQEAIAPVGLVGFFYWQHVTISKQGKAIAYDPDMKTLTIKQNTVLKKRPIDSRQLAPSELASLTAGSIYGLEGYSVSDIHFQVTLTEDLPPLGNMGYVFMGHTTIHQNGKAIEITPKRKVLGVPYFSQRDNPRDPFTTCNVTAIAMVLAFYGRRSRNPRQQLEDELYQWIIDRYGRQARTDNAVLQELYRAYGYRGGFSTTRTWAQIKQELLENRPVVIGGYFTHGGHIVTVIGFDEHGYIVHDPYGNALTGYRQTEGKGLRYPYIYMRDMCGVDGDVWAHFIAKA